MKKEKRKLTEQEIRELKATYRGQCSECGKEMNSYNVSNDGTFCNDCYEKNNS